MVAKKGGNMSKLIEDTYIHTRSNLRGVEHFDEEGIRNLLLGRRVEKIADDHMRLDNGIIVKVVPNEGCCCGAGDYHLDDLNDVDNVITAVKTVEELDAVDGYGEGPRTYAVFVVAADKHLNLFTVKGDDGNGYYGTGYRLLIRDPDA